MTTIDLLQTARSDSNESFPGERDLLVSVRAPGMKIAD